MKHKLTIRVSPNPQKSESEAPNRMVVREKYHSSIIRDKEGNLVMTRTERVKTIDFCETTKGGSVNE